MLAIHFYSAHQPVEQNLIIHQANTLVDYSNWFNVVLSSYTLTTSSLTLKYQYPPFHLHIPATPPLNIKQWGAPIDDDDDLFILDQLDEFESTDLSFISTPDHGFLHQIIPQPHIHPSSPSPSNPPKIAPYTKHTLPLTFPPYTRTAWLIPVRGTLPWPNATPALILHSSVEAPIPLTNNKIRWTHSSLRSFWSFLLHIKQAHTIGPIAISFHPSNPYPNTTNTIRSSQSLYPTPGAGGQPITPPSLTGTSTPTPTLLHPRAVLSNIDYIKIYHDAPHAMHLRNVLHLWSYTLPDSEHVEPRKIRVLKGARLVLVDERSKEVLVS